MNQSIKTLEAHNAWRRGNDSAQGNPVAIGRAIDDCVQAAKRYELIKTLTMNELKDLAEIKFFDEKNLDEIIDEMVKARVG